MVPVLHIEETKRRNGNKIGRYATAYEFTGRAIIFAVLIYTGTLYYRGSDIIAYKFLRARHCAPRDINGTLKRDVVRT